MNKKLARFNKKVPLRKTNKFSFSPERNKIDECEAKAIFYFDAMTKSINL